MPRNDMEGLRVKVGALPGVDGIFGRGVDPLRTACLMDHSTTGDLPGYLPELPPTPGAATPCPDCWFWASSL